MIYMWFTGINYYKLAVEKDRDSIFTSITTIWKPGLSAWGVLIILTCRWELSWITKDAAQPDRVEAY
jgi:hypothetical protein